MDMNAMKKCIFWKKSGWNVWNALETIFLPLMLIVLVVMILAYYHVGEVKGTEGGLDVLEVKARILEVDDSEVVKTGVASLGYQKLQVLVLEGEYDGQILDAQNDLMGQMDLDNIYHERDTILLGIYVSDHQIQMAKAVDLYRQGWLMYLFIVFVIALLLYARVIGIKALISFLLSVMILWEFLVKRLLNGEDPIMTTLSTLVLLSAVIIFLVAGFTKKGISAFIGTMSGLMVTLCLTLLFGRQMGLYGMTQPYVQSLIFSGYYDLNIRQIFYSAIILGASGAAMDIAMDIATSMEEIKQKKPEIGLRELIDSGFNVGRHVIGTMATTLLLAYSGGYLTLLMIFRVKNTSIMRMVNMKIVSAEIMRTLIGSVGLVLVAPITAIVAGYIMTKYVQQKHGVLNLQSEEIL